MKLSEWAKAHNLQYQTVWRWFKNGQLPIKAKQMPSGQIIVETEEETEQLEEKKEFSISPADIEVFKTILQEAQADKEIKIITHRDVVIQEDHSKALEKKIDKLMEEVLYIKLALQSKEDKVNTTGLKEALEKSFSATETADKLEKSALEQKEVAEKVKENILKEIKRVQKEKTEKLNKKEKATRNGKSVGFTRTEQFKIDELLKIGIDVIKKQMDYATGVAGTPYNIPSNDMSTMQKVVDKIDDSTEEMNEEQKVLLAKCNEWLLAQQDLVKKGIENTVTLSFEEAERLIRDGLKEARHEEQTEELSKEGLGAVKTCAKYLAELTNSLEELISSDETQHEDIDKDMKHELTIAATENLTKDAAIDELKELSQDYIDFSKEMSEGLSNIVDNDEPDKDVSRAVKIRSSKSS